MALFWILNLVLIHRKCGVQSLKAVILWSKVLSAVWAMASRLTYGVTIGYPKARCWDPLCLLFRTPPTRVSKLLIPATASWNEVFLPIDAEEILRILVCTCNIDDFWAWHPDKKGQFNLQLVLLTNLWSKLIYRERVGLKEEAALRIT